MKYIEARDIIKLNQKILSKVEGYPTGFQDPDGKEVLQSIVGRARKRTVPSEAAAEYICGLNTAHVFKSANKRTAFLAGEMFLGRNGVKLGITDEEAVKLSKDIRNGRLLFEEVEKYIKEKSRPGVRNNI